MKPKRIISTLLSLSLVVPILTSISSVDATNFDGKESYYYTLCSSKNLSTSKQKTCKSFNKYLKEKSSDLKGNISDTQDKIAATKDSIVKTAQLLESTEKDISDKNKQISYTEKSIQNTKEAIKDKEEKLKSRIYAMQSQLNSNIYLDYLFNAKSFTDFFSRLSTIGDITAYENELMSEIQEKQKDLQTQQITLNNAKSTLEKKQKEGKELQKSLNQKLKAANISLSDTKKILAKNEENIDSINANMKALAAAAAASQVAPVKKISTPKKTVIKKVTEKVTDKTTGKTKTVEKEEKVEVDDTSNIGVTVVNKALSRIGAPYIWGAAHSMSAIRNPNQWTFDCSGLVNWAFYQAGHSIGVQYTGSLVGMGVGVSRSSMQPGDIILFSSNGSRSGVHHVGIYIGNGQMVHAPTPGKTVQIANLSYSYWQNEWYNVRRLA